MLTAGPCTAVHSGSAAVQNQYSACMRLPFIRSVSLSLPPSNAMPSSLSLPLTRSFPFSLSQYLSFCSSLYFFSVSLCLCLSVSLSLCPSLYLSLSFSLSFSIYLSLLLCHSPSPYLMLRERMLFRIPTEYLLGTGSSFKSATFQRGRTDKLYHKHGHRNSDLTSPASSQFTKHFTK